MSTSLYNPMSVLGKVAKPLEHPYKGKVVQVDTDPNYIGRIKVSIPELYGDYQEGGEGILPWIYPRYYSNFSGRVKLDVPEKGDTVEVIFPYKNVYIGYYTNQPLIKTCWDDIAAIDAEAAAEIKNVFVNKYPNVYGTFDRNLTGWYIDKALNEVVLYQGKTKAKFRLDSEGSLHVDVPKSMYINVINDIVINATNILSTAEISNTGNVGVTGTVTASVDCMGGNVSLVGHTHPYSWTDGAGSSNTSAPNKSS